MAIAKIREIETFYGIIRPLSAYTSDDERDAIEMIESMGYEILRHLNPDDFPGYNAIIRTTPPAEDLIEWDFLVLIN